MVLLWKGLPLSQFPSPLQTQLWKSSSTCISFWLSQGSSAFTIVVWVLASQVLPEDQRHSETTQGPKKGVSSSCLSWGVYKMWRSFSSAVNISASSLLPLVISAARLSFTRTHKWMNEDNRAYSIRPEAENTLGFELTFYLWDETLYYSVSDSRCTIAIAETTSCCCVDL